MNDDIHFIASQEICIGILGNMACDSKICENMSKNNKLM